jgi:3-methylcrotonyl-CoA carboxylase alpha subunit
MFSPNHMIRRLLIANRGEIAVRIIRACREMDIIPIAVYSDADAAAMHVRLADAAVYIGPAPAAESYLRIDRVIEAAQRSKADAVHPGYGFLSENPDFASAVQAAGLIWVGPPASAIREMGSKTRARDIMQKAGVPIMPGYHSAPDGSFAKAANAIGYPVLVKAAGGGGGRGMRIVRLPADLQAAVTSAQAEALSAFGDATVFIEKYLDHGRHIEFQVFGDAHGHMLHLLERECSIQRRHQKLIEESPSPLLEAHPELRAAMGQAAVAAARAVGYQNAGTVEFIVDPTTLAFYFLEMNTRLQVEHPVTELVTGRDLVKLQLRVAAGEALPLSHEHVLRGGHALECRVYAENPGQGFLPSFGKILLAVEPRGPGVRVDSGFETGDTVSQFYDAMLAKVIVTGVDRAEAVARMDAALAQSVVLGLMTNVAFLRAVLAHPDFRAGTATTQLIAEHFSGWQPPSGPPPDEVLIAAALADATGARAASNEATAQREDSSGDPYNPWRIADGLRLGGR